MKAHVEPKSRECPFCGAPTYEVVSVTGMKCVRSIGGRKGKSFNRCAERKRKMNLIREIFFSPMVVDAAGIILIVAALPMVGWSWAVSHMAGPKVKNAKEGT